MFIASIKLNGRKIMSKHFNEDTRVKFPATIQFLRLGYNYLF